MKGVTGKLSIVTMMGIEFPNFLENLFFSHANISKSYSTGRVDLSQFVPTRIFVGRISGFSTLPIIFTTNLETFA